MNAPAGQLELFNLMPTAAADPARHHLVIAGRLVAYALRRDRRRLAMRIDERGLHIGAPRWLSLTEIEAFVVSHGEWVLQKLDELTNQAARRHLPIHDGARLPVLGREVRVRVTAGGNRGYWQHHETGSELWLAARPTADLAQLARRALQRRALEHCRPRLADMAARIGQPVPPLALSSARTRWGSCSSLTGIRLNWRLIHLPPELVDYVIAHETAHLLEMNHSPRFWAMVERLHPGWRKDRTALQRHGATLPLV